MEKKIVIIAGGNGVGKTTFAHTFLLDYPDYVFLNADEIAKSLSAENPAGKKISAGKLFFQKLDGAVAQNKSLLIESTLSGRKLRDRFKVWQRQDYEIIINFIFAESSEILIERIAQRVKKGGHFVPDEDVRRRFVRGKRNFWSVDKDLVNSWTLFYNSEGAFYQVALGENKEIEIYNENLYTKFMQI